MYNILLNKLYIIYGINDEANHLISFLTNCRQQVIVNDTFGENKTPKFSDLQVLRPLLLLFILMI